MQNGGAISERVKAQLLALGIPSGEHTAEQLAARFPPEFNIEAAGLEVTELAKVLVYFAGRGIIAVDAAGVGTKLKKVEPGWHFCQLYQDTEQLLGIRRTLPRALLHRQHQALSRGFKLLRAAGDTGWVSGTEQSRNFIDYEVKINAALGATKVAAVCTYRADVTADELVAIVSAHQDALYTPATEARS